MGKLFLVSHIKDIILDADEEVVEVAGGVSGMGEDMVGEVGDRACEGEVVGVHGTGSTMGPLTMIGAMKASRKLNCYFIVHNSIFI